jgi:hypothetical protein
MVNRGETELAEVVVGTVGAGRGDGAGIVDSHVDDNVAVTLAISR